MVLFKTRNKSINKGNKYYITCPEMFIGDKKRAKSSLRACLKLKPISLSL